MIQSLVTVDIASELKKIGFDEPCVFSYRNDNIYLEGSASVGFALDPNNADFVAAIEQLCEFSNRDISDWVTIPTYEQVFAWFRKKGLFHSITIVEDLIEGNIFFDSEIRNTDADIVTMFTGGAYEEAREELLKRLIKIYKDENNF